GPPQYFLEVLPPGRQAGSVNTHGFNHRQRPRLVFSARCFGQRGSRKVAVSPSQAEPSVPSGGNPGGIAVFSRNVYLTDPILQSTVSCRPDCVVKARKLQERPMPQTLESSASILESADGFVDRRSYDPGVGRPDRERRQFSNSHE